MSHSSFARHLGALGFLICVTASAQDIGDAGVALTLDDAAALAVAHQPLLDAQAAAITAARENAVASSQLPDPRLTGGVTDLTITGADRYTLRNESDTQFMLGVAQDFPRAEKRRLRGERGEREAQVAQQELTAMQLAVRRDAAL